ncbi:hypothetical protein GBZ48_27300 [Azospirillum melinis]|uniref:Uncharacterized protein n=1 Tax=Azospirillum melinis TaxID=328839 RepID=A0ABX2KMC4_9PROT|nr:hypothetical protein [Azospirillum melinis]MBP2305538.1 hypothetical protein [Azospirillum melinis]NUB02948.1 hypothetical protein [Azospirillum melinis]
MQGLSDFDRMVMASLCPSGALVLPLLPPDGHAADMTDGSGGDELPDRGLLPLGLGIVSAILLASLAALA